jgi:anti-sigma regulatory factor (Ser/Thr protein kinase)
MSTWAPGTAHGYCHEASLYHDGDEFLEAAIRFIEEAVEHEEPVLVALALPKIAALRSRVTRAASNVIFANMEELGRNPARIMPAWQVFLSEHPAGRGRLRGIGEPIVPAQDAARVAECQRHEALLNLPFSDQDFWLLCAYDASALKPEVIDEARRNHPYVRENGRSGPSREYAGADILAMPCRESLPTPPGWAASLTFGEGDLHLVRRLVGRHAAQAGISEDRVAEFVLAASEIATNSIRHGGGAGTLRVWRESGWFTCEFADAGRILDPMAGRVCASTDASGGRGLWIANQICDLVQIRDTEAGTAVRLRFPITRDPAGPTPEVYAHF